MQRSLQAQVRDPLWMLARQWQLGEFYGDDAGSPVQATLAVEFQNITTYRAGAGGAVVALDPKLPVEVHVEREDVALKLRGAVQLGLYFERQVRSRAIANAESVISAFRTVFRIASTSPDPTYAPAEAVSFRTLVSSRVVDGEALYRSAAAVEAGQVPPVALPPEAAVTGMPELLHDYVQYTGSLFTEPSGDAAWQSSILRYQFALGSPAPNRNITLEANDFGGGFLDWYSFSLGDPGAAAPPAQIDTLSFNFLPNHVTFHGMPDPRWWNFEDRVTDFGQLDADHVDLAKMLLIEFALVFGNDWFVIPVPTDVGVLSRVTTLVVTDTFGQRTLIRPSEQTQVNPGESPWSMFKIAGPASRSDFLLMAPTLGVVDEGEVLEEVLFLRDDMAAMAWAVEHKLQGELDAAVDAHEMYLDRVKRQPLPAPPTAQPDGPKIYYTLETLVPDNWIPMVPVKSPAGELYLRRGTMEVPGLGDLKARALILEPDRPFFLADRVVPHSGVLVQRYFRRTRSSDGTTFVWMARQSGQGRGMGWSGLRYDLVREMAAAAAP